jgi:Cof subfamily protein (haloacid dehalogenase superfamily)
MIKLVVTDIDDTLIAVGRPHATDHARAAIHELQDAGVEFSVVTGRRMTAIQHLFDGDERCYQTAITSNGQRIYLDGECIHTQYLSHDALVRAAEVIKNFEGYAIGLYKGHEVELVAASAEEVEHYGLAFWNKAHLVDGVSDHPYYKANVRVGHGPGVASRAEVRTAIARVCPEFSLFYPGPNYIDLLPSGWGKDSAVCMLAGRLGLEFEEVAAFGDEENDLNMLYSVPNSVAVANAVPAVKRDARWHIGASADDAVADAFYDIAAATRAGRMPSFMNEDEQWEAVQEPRGW